MRTRALALITAAVAASAVAVPSAAIATARPVTPGPAGPLGPTSTTVHKTGTAGPRLARTRHALAARTSSVVLVVDVGTGSTVDAVRKAADAGPGSVTHVLRQLDRVAVRVPAAQAASETSRLADLPGVRSVSRAARRYFADTPAETPDDTDYAADQAAYLTTVNAPAAWARSHGTGVTIAVVDSGIDVDHPDLAGKVVGTYNAHDDSTTVTDTVGHGTFVAGVAAAATNNALGVAGAGYDAKILAVKIDTPDASAPEGTVITTDDEARGITWAADHGADVINLSIGSSQPDQTEQDAITYAQGKGVLVVASAGNESSTSPDYPAGYPGVVAVGATDATGHRADFSNHGSWVTVAAPGTAIHSTAPTAGSYFFPGTSGYDTADGTSFSAPLVAGAAALLESTHPAATPARVTQALVDGAHHDASLDLGAGVVDFARTLDELPPTSAPGTPDASVSTGSATFTVASTAARVRFVVDGTPVAPTVTTGPDGTASRLLTTWGLANGTHTVAAQDCTVADKCTASGTATSFTVANPAPTVTSPKANQSVTGLFTLAASSQGGGLAFLIDGTRVGFDGSAPYSTTYSGSALKDGRHTVTVHQCDASGSSCHGPTSSPVVFGSGSLHPSVTSIAPNPFSPNGDKRRDTTTVRVTRPDVEYGTVRVLSPTGAVVRGPSTLGTTSGTTTWLWNGLGNGGTRLGSGTYTVVIMTSAVRNGITYRGDVRRPVVLDVAAPTMSSVTGNGTTFYPYRDSYRDTFAPTTRLNERSTLSLEVRTTKNVLVRTITATRNAGLTSLAWNGTNSAGRSVADGRYIWRLVAQDTAGNRRATGNYTVYRSSKKLVTTSTTYTRNGDAGDWYGPDCTDLYQSTYAHGVDAGNLCDPASYGPQIIVGFFGFTLPSAVSYSSLSLTTTGASSFPPTEIFGSFTRTDVDDVTLGTPVAVRSGATATYSLGSVSAVNHVTSRHTAEVSLAVDNYYGSPSDFDVASISFKVTYKVLR